MKRFFLFLIAFFNTVILAYSSTSLIVDSSGDMAGGFYAKAPGYIEGDLITLKNTSTGESVEVRNLGDSQNGELLIISSEVANYLKLENIENLQFELPKRNSDFSKKTSVQALIINPDDESYFASIKENVEKKSADDSFALTSDEKDESKTKDYSVKDSSTESDYLAELKNSVEKKSTDDNFEILPDENNSSEENILAKEKEAVENQAVEKVISSSEPSKESALDFEDAAFGEQNKISADHAPSNDEEFIFEDTAIDETKEVVANHEIENPIENENAKESETSLSESNQENQSELANVNLEFDDAAQSEQQILADKSSPSNDEELAFTDTAASDLSSIQENQNDDDHLAYVQTEESTFEEIKESEKNESDDSEILNDDIEDSLAEDDAAEKTNEVSFLEEDLESDGGKGETSAVEIESVPEELPPAETTFAEEITEEPIEEAPLAEEEVIETSDSVSDADKENPNEPVADLTIPETLNYTLPVQEEKAEESSLESTQVSEDAIQIVPLENNIEEKVQEKSLPLAETEEKESPKAEENDSYKAIILLPSEDLLPSAEKTPQVAEESSQQEISQKENVQAEEEKDTITSSVVEKHLVKVSDLDRDLYYVQIATLSNLESIEKIIGDYEKYPILLLQSEGSYKVLVGPLTINEYGQILARFKNFGFKDAFLYRKK